MNDLDTSYTIRLKTCNPSKRNLFTHCRLNIQHSLYRIVAYMNLCKLYSAKKGKKKGIFLALPSISLMSNTLKTKVRKFVNSDDFGQCWKMAQKGQKAFVEFNSFLVFYTYYPSPVSNIIYENIRFKLRN